LKRITRKYGGITVCAVFVVYLTTLSPNHNDYMALNHELHIISKVNKKFISHLTGAQRTRSAAATVQVSHALQAGRW
jgi:hypothetical protein